MLKLFSSRRTRTRRYPVLVARDGCALYRGYHVNPIALDDSVLDWIDMKIERGEQEAMRLTEAHNPMGVQW